MPQLTRFPHLPQGDPDSAVDALVTLCREVPVEGEPFRQFRDRLRALGLWDSERVDDTLGFFRMVRGDVIVPSPIMRRIATAEGDARANEALAERLWIINPILFKAVVERLAERIYPRDELIAAIDSFAYQGAPITRPQLEAWLKLALGLKVLRIIGIALTLDERGQSYAARAAEIDVAEFLDEDQPEELPEPIRLAQPAEADDEPEPEADPAVPAPMASAPSIPVRVPALGVPDDLASPLGRERPVPVPSFAGQTRFDDQVLADTSRRVAAWWSEQAAAAAAPSADGFGIDAEAWMESSQEVLYRLAVAAALVFRLGADRDAVERAYRELDTAGVLDDLYYGTAPDTLPERLDPKALMLASLVARRCAESPELAGALERADSASAAFATLHESLGRGLLGLELFWIMRQLGDLGALRFDDLADYTALPHRVVRDQLFRMGFVDSPYAADTEALARAAAATRRAAGDAPAPDKVIAGFVAAAGCAYECPNRRRCEYACKERAE
jgi:hypothetical protein